MHSFFYNMFIWILYMFRATLCSSSGRQLYEYNIWYNHSVLVALWTATNRVIIPEAVLIHLSFWGWAQICSKHVDYSNRHIIEEIVCQVVPLPELYEDARSEKYKIYAYAVWYGSTSSDAANYVWNIVVNSIKNMVRIRNVVISGKFKLYAVCHWDMNYSGNSLKLDNGNNTNKFVVPEVSELWGLALQSLQFLVLQLRFICFRIVCMGPAHCPG